MQVDRRWLDPLSSFLLLLLLLHSASSCSSSASASASASPSPSPCALPFPLVARLLRLKATRTYADDGSYTLNGETKSAEWVACQLPFALDPSGFAIRHGLDNGSDTQPGFGHLRNWKVEGSKDGVAWDTIARYADVRRYNRDAPCPPPPTHTHTHKRPISITVSRRSPCQLVPARTRPRQPI